MTQCTQECLEFEGHFSRGVEARFDGGAVTSDAGGLLLRAAERRINLLSRLAVCFDDRRNPALVQHTVEQMVAQRVYGLALGYGDLNDHEQLREDPLLAVFSGKREAGARPLTGKSTLNRLELSAAQPGRYKKVHCRPEAVDELLVALFLEAHPQPPEEIVLDLDVTDLLMHALRRLGLQGTELERAQASTNRLRLLKTGARIRITARRIWVSMASGFPLQAVFQQAWAQLRC